MFFQARGFIGRALTDTAFSPLQEQLCGLSTILHLTDRATPEIRIGTICSGIGTQEMVGDIFNDLWKTARPGYPLKAREIKAEIVDSV